MRTQPPTVRPLLIGLLLAVVVLAAAALLPGEDRSSGPVAPTGPAAPVADRTGPLAVVRAWDHERATAWRRGDLRALGRLYVPGSGVGRSDRRMLAAYLDRGLRVTGMRMQVASAQVEHADAERLVVVLTDRLAPGAEARGSGRALPLPRDGWSLRRVVLRREGEGPWRVAAVTAQPGPDASPAATTASTSASANS